MLKKNSLRYLTGFSLLLLFILTGSCRKDFETHPSEGKLRFSKDTVFLDTVFSNIGSSTYRLTVYNDSRKDISIPQIKLNQGENSKYRLNVDGIPGTDFKNIENLDTDSIYVFIVKMKTQHILMIFLNLLLNFFIQIR